MRGVILAGGTGSRLLPLTAKCNKHLIRVGKRLMVEYPLSLMRSAGIVDVLIVTNQDHAGDFVNQFGSGRSLGLDLTYRVQDRNDTGSLLDGLAAAEPFANGERLLVCLGDQFFGGRLDLGEIVGDFASKEKNFRGCTLFTRSVADARPYGVIEFSGDQVVKMVEKPSSGSGIAVAGLYCFDSSVFSQMHAVMASVSKANISHVINRYIDDDYASAVNLVDFWADMGTFSGIKAVEEYLASQ